MPSLMKDEAKLRALKEVTEGVEEIRVMDELLQMDAAQFESISLTFNIPGEKKARGKKPAHVDFPTDSKAFQKVMSVLDEYKRQQIRSTVQTAKKYGIVFNESEIRLLGLMRTKSVEGNTASPEDYDLPAEDEVL